MEQTMELRPGKGTPELKIELSEYRDGLYGYAFVLSRNRTDAEDLVQETCLRAIRGVEKLRPDSNVKSWLFTILRNVWLNPNTTMADGASGCGVGWRRRGRE
jgi:DNA-directed RNA polymerase specialized sigma24 family protein